MYPVIMLCGKAGSGKDTVAGFMAEKGGVCIAQADPMKRFVRDAFGFTEEQLWGPSSFRNAVVAQGEDLETVWDNPEMRHVKQDWVHDIGLDRSYVENLDEWAYKYIFDHGDITPRHVLQTLGTEMGRAIDADVWVRYAQKMATKLLTQGGTYNRFHGYAKAAKRVPFVVITDGRFANEILATKERHGLVINVVNPAEGGGLAGAAGVHASEAELNGIPPFWYDLNFINDKGHGLDRCRELTFEVLDYITNYGAQSLHKTVSTNL